MRYKFIIVGSSWDLYKQSYSDLYDKDFAEYICEPPQNIQGIDRIIYNIQHNPHIYNRINLPFKERWFKYYFQESSNVDNLCFVFFGRNLLDDYQGYQQYLKKLYPEAKFVLFFQDLFYMHHDRKNNGLNLSEIEAQFDLILSFDQNDCKKYGFTYHPLVFSSFHGQLKEMPFFDVYFLGKAKNRLFEIVACFEKLWDCGVSTDIYLVGVDEKKQVYKDKIHYINNMSYPENLQHVLHCNCELEIMQAGGHGYTQRMCEVISLDKKLITNNPIVHEAPFYNPDYIFQIKSAEDITSEMCEKIKKHEPVDYHYKENLSPVELLQFIEKHLSE